MIDVKDKEVAGLASAMGMGEIGKNVKVNEDLVVRFKKRKQPKPKDEYIAELMIVAKSDSSSSSGDGKKKKKKKKGKKKKKK